jgi:hypothetical protein
MLPRKTIVIVALCLLVALAYPLLRIPAVRFVAGSVVLGLVMLCLLQPERFTRFLAGFKENKEPKHWIDSI